MLQVKDVGKVGFLAISSDLPDRTVSVKADASTAAKRTGPVFLFGEMVKLFAGDLSELTAETSAKGKVANLTVQIGATV